MDDERRLIVGSAIGVTIYLALIPLLVLVYASLKPEGTLPFEAEPLVLDNYFTLFTDPSLVRVLANTALYVAGSLLIGLPIGAATAWLIERTDLPHRHTIYVLLFLPMAVPPMVTTIGYVLLFGPRSGLVNVYLRALVGSTQPSGPFDMFSLGAMIVLTGLLIVPSLVLMIGPVLRAMDPALEEAAATSGAAPLEALRRITLPLSIPGLSSAAIYYCIILIEILEIPLLIGLTVDIPVLSTYVYILTQGQAVLPKYALASAVGVIGLVVGAGLMFVYFRVTRGAPERFAVVTGKGYRARRWALGRWRFVAFSLIGLYVVFMIVLPAFALVWASLLPFWQLPSAQAFATLTLSNYTTLFGDPSAQRAYLNSLLLFVGAASGAMLLATLISWAVVRVKARGIEWLDVIAFLPLAIPSIVFALALLLLYLGTPLHGTLLVLIIAHTTRYLPFSVRSMSAAQLQIHRELEESASTSGAGTATVLGRIVLPLLMPSFVNGWLWVASHSMRDFAFPLMLTQGGTVFATFLFFAWTQGLLGRASAAAVVLTLTTVAIVALSRWYTIRKWGAEA